MNITESAKLLDDARRAFAEVNNEMTQQRRLVEEKYRKLQEIELKAIDDEYADRLRLHRQIIAEHQRRYEELRIEHNRSMTLGGVPIGGKVVEWRKEYSHVPSKPTGRVGVIELCTRESKFPSGRQGPDISLPFVRILKKDGTPSLLFEYARCLDEPQLPYGWYPEGKTPK